MVATDTISIESLQGGTVRAQNTQHRTGVGMSFCLVRDISMVADAYGWYVLEECECYAAHVLWRLYAKC